MAEREYFKHGQPFATLSSPAAEAPRVLASVEGAIQGVTSRLSGGQYCRSHSMWTGKVTSAEVFGYIKQLLANMSFKN
jgi:hypothetical protein